MEKKLFEKEACCGSIEVSMSRLALGVDLHLEMLLGEPLFSEYSFSLSLSLYFFLWKGSDNLWRRPCFGERHNAYERKGTLSLCVLYGDQLGMEWGKTVLAVYEVRSTDVPSNQPPLL